MRLFYFASKDQHLIQMLSFFRQNIADQNFELHEKIYPPICTDTNRGGGYAGWCNRYKTITDAFSICSPGEYFITSDIDIRYYQKIESDILGIIRGKPSVDLWFQKEGLEIGVNIGFMVIKNSPKIKHFFNVVNDIISANTIVDEQTQQIKINHPRRRYENNIGAGQDHLNDILYNNNKPEYNYINYCMGFDFSWSRLPNRYWHPGLIERENDPCLAIKENGIDRYYPEKIFIHHATCTGNQTEKMKQLKYID